MVGPLVVAVASEQCSINIKRSAELSFGRSGSVGQDEGAK